MNHNKIACIGEMLIDFVCTDIGIGLKNGENFLKSRRRTGQRRHCH